MVVGEGGSAKECKKYEKTGLVNFAGRVNDEEISKYLSEAKALLFPGVEDFGIIPVEANAAGCPVIAFRKGGALDSIKEGVTGMFFDEQTAESLAKAIEAFEKLPEGTFSNRKDFSDHVAQFSQAAFTEKIKALVNEKKSY